MRIAKIVVAFCMMVVLTTSSSSQWRKIADFKGFYINDSIPEDIAYIYFLDLPGPPRIGYVGTESELWKTTDGGKSWYRSWAHEPQGSAMVTGVCFKDTVEGWFAYQSIPSIVYRTQDGGNTWYPLPQSASDRVPGVVWYSSATNRLFFSQDDSIRVSTNLGDTWESSLSFGGGGFSFSSPLVGISFAGLTPGDTIFGIIRTTDGGINWHFKAEPFLCYQPLAIFGTSIAFAVNFGRMIVFRSDDSGETWKLLKDFGPYQDSNFNSIGPYGTGVVRGDLARLYIQSDSGMYVSTDEGVSWTHEGGPPSEGGCIFYATKGVAMTGMTYNDGVLEDGGLWEEDWPQSGVVRSASKDTGVFVTENPFDKQTTLHFTLSEASYTEVDVLDVLGREVALVGAGRILDVGEHQLPVDLSGCTAGTYYLRISLGTGEVRTMKLVKK